MTAAEVAGARRLVPGAFARPAAARARVVAAWAAFAGLVLFCLWSMNFSPWRLAAGVGRLGWLAGLMLPPSHGGRLADYLDGILETLGMAFLGTLLATVAAVLLGFLGARNVVTQWLVHFGLRRGLDGLRSVDALIWALMFVNVVGLGPFAGVMALALSDVGTLSKLFAEAIENIDAGQVDGVRAAGASAPQVVRFAILPQVSPVILGNALYFFESNTRSASILGVVGAGGIGFHLADRIRLNNWDEVGFIVLLILVTVGAIDALSKTIRMRLIRASG